MAAPRVVELALVRITRLPSLGESAAGLNDVFAFLDALRRTSYRRVEPGGAHEAHFRQLCRDYDLRGNDVNDAYLAALALEHGATLVSLDRGFGRFKGLRWREETG